ncbi:MAG: hypothetical protein R3A79_19235 [Nannocystaceae bacterium]
MPITEELTKLGQSVRRLNEGSAEIDALVAAIDARLGALAIPFDYLHPRPLRETTTVGAGGKRVIEVAYIGFLPYHGQRCLVVKTVKIHESKAAAVAAQGGSLTPLVQAPRGLVHATVDVLGEVVRAIRSQLDELAAQVDRRAAAAQRALAELEGSDGAG